MTEYEAGCLVQSLAGHDRGGLFIIIREDGDYVYLADGRTRSVSKPKRKKKKHVQLHPGAIRSFRSGWRRNERSR